MLPPYTLHAVVRHCSSSLSLLMVMPSQNYILTHLIIGREEPGG
jgi:hypothetical protein